MSYASPEAVLNAQWHAANMALMAEEARMQPHVLMRPRVSIDSNQWCALYGDNIQEGVAGFGDSPAAAMADFDRNWSAQLKDTRP